MKVAVCISGQPRSFEKGFEYHKKNLFDHYECDVYLHTWSSVPEETKGAIMDLYGNENVVNFCSMEYDDVPADYIQMIDDLVTRIPNPEFPASNTYRMWYGIWKSLHKALEPDGFKLYDVIIRSRYDYALNIVPPLESTLINRVYVPADRITPQHDFCADMFAWGTPRVMEKYSKTFHNIFEYYENGTMFIGEDLLAAQLKSSGLTGKNMVYVDMNNPFPPGPYNGNWHSLIRDDFKDWNNLRG